MEKYSTKRAGCVRKIETPGGDYALKWDDETQMSVNAHAALLSQFAKAGGFFDSLVETCPMRLTSNNAPEVRDLVATVMVPMVNGATRFRHFDRLHGDAATAELFGVGRFMSCDSVRRNFASIPEGQALPWVWRENLRLLQDVIAEDYILDPTVKPLYGHQEGAELGYNPHKPGRPSHCYHTLCIAKLRLTLAVVVHPGDETSGTHSRSMLAEYLEFVSSVKKPRLVRGDVSFGNESVIGDCEDADVRHMFKTKRSKVVRGVFRELLANPVAWRDSPEGWQCAERDVRLDSWGKERRMVFARRQVEKMPGRRKNPPQMRLTQLDIPGLELVEAGDGGYADGYEWHALVTDLGMDARDILPLYRGRGDCENIFDEYKNQWGWGGFVTRDIKSTRATARITAIVANWWNVFCRLADGERHMEPVTSRPMLLGLVGRIVSSGRRRLMHLTSTHTASGEIRHALERIGAFLGRISATAPQLGFERTWTLILKVAFRKWLGGRPLEPLADGPQMLLPMVE